MGGAIMKLSLIVPCYNEQDNVELFFQTTSEVLQNTHISYEIIFVDDGSKDHTYNNLNRLYEKYPELISVISFSRNFGKDAAIYAGLKHSKGDYVAIIDADLQQRPEVVVDMIKFLDIHPEYDVVAAYQQTRIEGKTMSGLKNMFYKLINRVCDIEFYSGASDFRTFRRKVVAAILSLPEYFRFSKGIFSWVGFETYYMPYTVQERHSGESKWSFKKLLKYALEGFISFTTFPLTIATYLGASISIISIIYMMVVIIQKIFFSIDLPGYPTIVVLILLLGGIQLMILGIIGEYIARIYIQGKNRPIYIEKNYLQAKKDVEKDADSIP